MASPVDVTSATLVAYFDAADESSITGTTTVTAVDNLEGTAAWDLANAQTGNAVQSGLHTDPLGKNVLSFDSGQVLSTSGATITSPYTVSLYFYAEAIDWLWSGTDENVRSLHSAPNLGAYAGADVFNVSQSVGNSAWHRVVWVFDGASSTVYYNGTDVGFDGGSPSSPGTNSLVGLVLGARGSLTSSKLGGRIARFSIHNGAVDATDAGILDDWLENSSGVIALTTQPSGFYQRHGSTRNLTVAGTYSSGSPSSIDIYTVEHDSETVVMARTTLDASPSGGTFSGTVDFPAGVAQRIRVAFNDDSEMFSASNVFGVGALVLKTGQSLELNQFKSGGSGVTPDDSEFRYDCWAVVGTPIASPVWQQTTTLSSGSRGRGESEFAKTLIASLGVAVGQINSAGGGALAAENDDLNGTWGDHSDVTPRTTAIAHVATSNGGTAEAELVVFGGAQADASATVDNATVAQLYYAIDTMVTAFRAGITNRSTFTNLPVILVLLGDSNGTYYDNDNAVNKVNAAMLLAANALEDVYVVASYDNSLSDAIHNDGAGQAVRAIDTADTFLNSSVSPKATRVTKVSDTVIDVTVTNGSGLATGTKSGFEVLNIETMESIAISSAAQTSTTNIRLTLSANCEGDALVFYMRGEEPANTSSALDTAGKQLLNFYGLSTAASSGGGFEILDTLNNDAAFNAIFAN